jgi:hypothetical protein
MIKREDEIDSQQHHGRSSNEEKCGSVFRAASLHDALDKGLRYITEIAVERLVLDVRLSIGPVD